VERTPTRKIICGQMITTVNEVAKYLTESYSDS